MNFQEFLVSKGYVIKDPVLNEDGTVKEEGTSAADMTKYHNEFNAIKGAEITAAITADVENKNKEAIAELKAELLDNQTKHLASQMQQSESINKILEAQALELTRLKDVSADTPVMANTLVKEITEKAEQIKHVMRTAGNGEVELKALTNLASVANNAQGVFLPGITQLGHKERSLYNVLPKITVSDDNTGGVVRYRDWDAATTVRAAAMVAEGAVFPESTAKFAWYSLDLRKIGDTLPVTEEFFEDEALAASELEMFLDINVNLVIDNQLINGDNTGQNLKGVFNSAIAYVAPASGITFPNIKDLVIKMRNEVTRVNGSKFSPDMLLVNSLTMESLILAKDANGNYIFDENTGTIGGLFVVVDENVANNALAIGDRRYARIYEKTGVVISRGVPNAQFLEDEMTLKARKRMLLLIKNGDATGFLKVTDVTAALALLAT
ncbi:MAG: HK97 family phage major capsid protein [Enterobacterales bacterium]|jgi:HK97 family phage major capsid protein